VRVLITRRGGLAGVPLHADVATSDLGPEAAARVQGALDRLMNQPQAASPPQPDRFSYEITVPDRNRSITVAEHDLPAELTPLVEMLSKVGTVGKPPPPS
jgi:emfourin